MGCKNKELEPLMPEQGTRTWLPEQGITEQGTRTWMPEQGTTENKGDLVKLAERLSSLSLDDSSTNTAHQKLAALVKT